MKHFLSGDTLELTTEPRISNKHFTDATSLEKIIINALNEFVIVF